MSKNRPANVQALIDLISSSVDAIADQYAAANIPFPNLDDFKQPFAPQVAMLPDVFRARIIAIGACSQLMQLIEVPPLALVKASVSFHVPSCLRVVIEAHVAELLVTYGSNGLHVEEIGRAIGIPSGKIGRILRLLCTQHIFKEVQPNVFANNRLSIMMSTGKDFEIIKAQPETQWYNDTSGLAAIITHTAEDVFQCSAYLSDTLRTPGLKDSYTVEDTALKLAHNFDGGIWKWLQSNERLNKRFNMAMVGMDLLTDPFAILKAFNWESLPKNATIVDIGGGVGHQTRTLHKNFPQFHYVIQDLPQVTLQAIQFWEKEAPSAVSNNEVEFLTGSFFDEIIPKDSEVYFARMIFHDWGQDECVKILKNLQEAMPSKKSKLLIIDQVLMFAAPSSTLLGVPTGYQTIAPPAPLLSNCGLDIPYYSDLQMMAVNNGEERTIGEWINIMDKTDFKVESISGDLTGMGHSFILCSPQ